MDTVVRESKLISLEELRRHGSRGSDGTWLLLHGRIYDVSGFAARHPGGSAPLLAVCGAPGEGSSGLLAATEAFESVGHSGAARAQLAALEIGVLQTDAPAAAVEDAVTSTKAGSFEPKSFQLDHEPAQVVTSQAARWHAERRRQMLKAHPEIEALLRKDWAPWFYGPFCVLAFLAIALLVLPHVPWWAVVLLAWTALPWLSFGLNNMNHELCHGRLMALPGGCCGNFLTGAVMLVNGVVPLNHFTFYYYYHSHLSHHRVLGSKDRGHAFRELYCRPTFLSSETQQAEQEWDVDGDLFGVHPFLVVRDILAPPGCACFATLAAFFFDPTVGFLEQRSCMKSGSQRLPTRIFTMSIIFGFLRVWIDIFSAMNLVGTVLCRTLLCNSFRRPWELSLTGSYLVIILMHAVYFHFGGAKCWLGVWLSSLAHPTFIPLSLWFGYFTGIHAGHETADGQCQTTVSIYGPLTYFLTFGQSLHLEHHDFPQIPCRLLPQLRRLAPEFYSQPNVVSYSGFVQPWADYFLARRGGIAYASCAGVSPGDVHNPASKSEGRGRAVVPLSPRELPAGLPQSSVLPEGFVRAKVLSDPAWHTDETLLLVLEAPLLTHQVPPGGHVLLGLPRGVIGDATDCAGGKERAAWAQRPYTPWRSDGARLHFLVKVYGDGVLSPRLARLRAEDELGICGPRGTPLFQTLRQFEDVRLVAAGTGLAPLLPLARALIGDCDDIAAGVESSLEDGVSSGGPHRVRLLSCQRGAAGAPLLDELASLSAEAEVASSKTEDSCNKRRKCKFEVCHALSSAGGNVNVVAPECYGSGAASAGGSFADAVGRVFSGRLSASMLNETGFSAPQPRLHTAAVVICGPPMFCTEARRLFAATSPTAAAACAAEPAVSAAGGVEEAIFIL